MFASPFVDAFSRVPWYAVPLVFVPIILALFGWGVTGLGIALVPALGLYAAGWFVWTLTEYWLHRTLFHWEPHTGARRFPSILAKPKGSFGEDVHFILHGVHHEYVHDHYRLVMPPAASLFLGGIFFAMWYLLLGVLAFPFMAGKVSGYLFYDMVHYYAHHGKPKSEWMKRLRQHHLVHHFKKNAANSKFGVSTTLWDHVFATYEPSQKEEAAA